MSSVVAFLVHQMSRQALDDLKNKNGLFTYRRIVLPARRTRVRRKSSLVRDINWAVAI